MTVEEKINHLKSIKTKKKYVFNGDLTEVKKMYDGRPFNVQDPMYKKLVSVSKKICEQYTLLLALISVKKCQGASTKTLENQKNRILDLLFPVASGPLAHERIIGVGAGLDVVIGMVEVEGSNYLGARIKAYPSSIVQLGKHAFVDSDVTFGMPSKGPIYQTGLVIIGHDTWIGRDAKFLDLNHSKTSVGCQSVVGYGSVVEANTTLTDDSVSFGNPCRFVRNIEKNEETVISQIPSEAQFSASEVDDLIKHIQEKLEITGDFTEYKKALNYERYNLLDPVCMAIFDASHYLCIEYDYEKTTLERKKEILDLLFPYHGENLVVGNDLYVDGIGVRVGKNVQIGSGVKLALGTLLKDNVVIGDDTSFQTMGYDINYQTRRLDNGSCLKAVPAYILIEEDTVLENGTIVGPNTIVQRSVFGQPVSIGSKLIRRKY